MWFINFILYSQSEEFLDDQVEVHGGVTFAGERCNYENEWWFFGFDCSHSGDLTPATKGRLFSEDNYCDFDWTKKEVTQLAQQIVTLEYKLKKG